MDVIDMTELYKQGDTVKLVKDVKTPSNKFKKGEQFTIEYVLPSTVYLISDNGSMTIHRMLHELIKKA